MRVALKKVFPQVLATQHGDTGAPIPYWIVFFQTPLTRLFGNTLA